MKIAIVILNWNGKELLEKFLPSVIAYSKEAVIYIADNASTDNSIAFIKTNYPNIKIIKNTANYGYAKGYNEVNVSDLTATGVLYYKLETSNDTATRKMILVK